MGLLLPEWVAQEAMSRVNAVMCNFITEDGDNSPRRGRIVSGRPMKLPTTTFTNADAALSTIQGEYDVDVQDM